MRGPADRRRDRGAREHRAPRADGQERARGGAGRHPGDRPGGAGHHAVHRRGVPADRLHGRHHRQVLPRVRHHHRRGGADLDVRQLHARPDAVVSVWHDPAIEAHGKPNGQPARCTTSTHRPRHRLVRPRHAMRWRDAYQGILRWSLGTSWPRWRWRVGDLRRQRLRWCRCWAPSSCPRPTSPRPASTSTRRWARRWRSPRRKARQVDAVAARIARGAATPLTTINTGSAAGQDLRVGLRAAGRPQGPRSAASTQMTAPLRERLAQVPGHHRHHVGLLDAWAATSRSQFSLQGPDLAELERLADAGDRRGCAPSPAWSTWTPALKPDKPTIAVDVQARRRLRPGPVAWRRSPARCARWWPARRWATGARRRRELRRQRAPGARGARRAAATWSACRSRMGSNADGSAAHRAAVAGGRRDARRPARTRSTGAT